MCSWLDARDLRWAITAELWYYYVFCSCPTEKTIRYLAHCGLFFCLERIRGSTGCSLQFKMGDKSALLLYSTRIEQKLSPLPDLCSSCVHRCAYVYDMLLCVSYDMTCYDMIIYCIRKQRPRPALRRSGAFAMRWREKKG